MNIMDQNRPGKHIRNCMICMKKKDFPMMRLMIFWFWISKIRIILMKAAWRISTEEEDSSSQEIKILWDGCSARRNKENGNFKVRFLKSPFL